MQKQLRFKISSALKNIIGQDLINDDLIAIFELVKNAYDARATRVDIKFENIYSKNGKIVISDNGKGMSFEDLQNKWLFVAYSAKKEGTEDDNADYRSKLSGKRAFAGAKGIGRFSCDRLGSELYLETIKDSGNSKVETLLTDWDQFDNDLRDEFINISVLHETIAKSTYGKKTGTVLEISKLKSDWDRKKFLKLKDALAKLINPTSFSIDDDFKIYLSVAAELNQDSLKIHYNEIVNGEIENNIFDVLDLKTTKIKSKISDKTTNQISTSLYEGGRLVYNIEELNKFEGLHNVTAELYYLNRSAKIMFKKRMGVDPVNYGNVFIYKNGLRIYPYGERGEDPLSIDVRKAQGVRRYLGTREVIGFITIHEPNGNLRETSSRGDGLVKSKEYFALREWFFHSLRRMEKFNIDIVKWGNELSSEDYIRLDDFEKQLAIKKLIANLTRSKNILTFEVPPEIFEIIDIKQGDSSKSSLSKIKIQLASENFDKDEIVEAISKVEKNVEHLTRDVEDATDTALEALFENEKLEEKLEKAKKKGAFQGALIGSDKERIMGLQHQIYHSSSRISRNLKLLLRHVGKDILDTKTKKYIRVISLEAAKINSIANFVTKANFDLRASDIQSDIVGFIKDYLNEIYILESRVIDTGLKMSFVDDVKGSFIRNFRPLELTTVIDNIISNSEKGGASKLTLTFVEKRKKLTIAFSDNGKGMDKNDVKYAFDLGFTTTDGSGIGLFQVKSIIEQSFNGQVEIESSRGNGTTIKIEIA